MMFSSSVTEVLVKLKYVHLMQYCVLYTVEVFYCIYMVNQLYNC
jgi:hypothetical protein